MIYLLDWQNDEQNGSYELLYHKRHLTVERDNFFKNYMYRHRLYTIYSE